MDRSDSLRLAACRDRSFSWANRNQLWSYDEDTQLLRAHGGVCLDRDRSLHVWSCNANNSHQQWKFVRHSHLTEMPTSETTTTAEVIDYAVAVVEQAATKDAQSAARGKDRHGAPCTSKARFVQITNHKGECLDAGGEHVHAWTCDASNANQRWVRNQMGLISAGTQNFCLDAGGDLHLWPCNLSNVNQVFTVHEVDQRIRVHGDRCLDAGGSVHVWKCNATNPSQNWTVASLDDLDMDSPCDVSYSEVEPGLGAKTSAGSEEMHHASSKSLEGLVQIKHSHGLCLDAQGADIRAARCNNSNPSQQWSLSGGEIMLSSFICLGASKTVWVGRCEMTIKTERLSYNHSIGEIYNDAGLCLASLQNGSHLTMKECDRGAESQRWSLGEKHILQPRQEALRELSLGDIGQLSAISGFHLERTYRTRKALLTSITAFSIGFLLVMGIFWKSTRPAGNHRDLHMKNDQEAEAPLVDGVML